MNYYKIIFKDNTKKILKLENYESLIENLDRKIIKEVKEVLIKNRESKKYVQIPKPIDGIHYYSNRSR